MGIGNSADRYHIVEKLFGNRDRPEILKVGIELDLFERNNF